MTACSKSAIYNHKFTNIYIYCMCIYIYIYIGVRGLPERDMLSLCVMGRGAGGGRKFFRRRRRRRRRRPPSRFSIFPICCPWIKGLCRFCRRLRRLLWARSVFHNAIVKKTKRHKSCFRRKFRRKYEKTSGTNSAHDGIRHGRFWKNGTWP